jgi:hypothetical protein
MPRAPRIRPEPEIAWAGLLMGHCTIEYSNSGPPAIIWRDVTLRLDERMIQTFRADVDSMVREAESRADRLPLADPRRIPGLDRTSLAMNAAALALLAPEVRVLAEIERNRAERG